MTEPTTKPVLQSVLIVGAAHGIESALPQKARRLPTDKMNFAVFCDWLKLGIPLREGIAVIINANGCGGKINELLAPYDFLGSVTIVWNGIDSTNFRHAGDAPSLLRALNEMFLLPP